MNFYTLPFFGKIENPTEFDYQDVFTISGQDISIQISFEEGLLDDVTIQKLQFNLHHLEEIIQQCQNHVLEDFQQKGETYKYIEELQIYNSTYHSNTKEEILNKIELKEIRFYPEHETYFMVLDYKLKSERYILILRLDYNGKILEVTVES